MAIVILDEEKAAEYNKKVYLNRKIERARNIHRLLVSLRGLVDSAAILLICHATTEDLDLIADLEHKRRSALKEGGQ